MVAHKSALKRTLFLRLDVFLGRTLGTPSNAILSSVVVAKVERLVGVEVES